MLSSCSLRSFRTEVVRSPCGIRTGPRGDGVVTVGSLCSFCIHVQKVYNHISACVVGEMAPKTKGGKGKRSKKKNNDPSQGGRTVSGVVSVGLPQDNCFISVRFYGHCTGTVRQLCDSSTGAVRLSQEPTIIVLFYLAQMTI